MKITKSKIDYEIPFENLKGKIFCEISQTDELICFYVSDNEFYKMYHREDCCESVVIESISGELDWIVGHPILLAEERTCREIPGRPFNKESETWTFYEIATIKGAVTIRWYGYSNGYYSERVQIDHVILQIEE
jgi:hypothetical protein|uniref:DUF7448 domain-containing protein n=1 Tax=uncultured Caudovirales phage TaxID=2100421 RepID=A0A6J5KVD1_9CAUD|nr:hypothetical protein UFOVP88_65 [uncultured Caudovirales phage]